MMGGAGILPAKLACHSDIVPNEDESRKKQREIVQLTVAPTNASQ